MEFGRRTAMGTMASVGAVFLALGAGCQCREPQWPPHEPPAGAVPECTSLLGRPLFATPPGDVAKLDRHLAEARAAYEADPADPDKLIWVGRRLGYLWRMNEAITVYTEGIERFPDYAPLYRHRGHRYISIRKFAEAERDLEQAAELIEGKPDVIEQDGMPNEKNIPLTTLGFNVWYHLGLARLFQFDKGKHDGAVAALQEAMKYTRGYDDNRVAVTYWLWLFGNDDSAALLVPIDKNMSIIENRAYFELLLLFKGERMRKQVFSGRKATDLDRATLGYGVAMYEAWKSKGERARTERALAVLREVANGPYWPAFGQIAAEAWVRVVQDPETKIGEWVERHRRDRQGADE
jgi:tetratricopeptide (TPR) repeat protein